MERKLRLVPPPAADPGDDAPASAEERAEAEALRRALEQGDDPLAAQLRAAFAPGDLEGPDLDALVARAMGDEDAATAAERRAAERLRAELAGEAPVHEAEVLTALRVAAAPPALDARANDALIARAFSRADARAARRGLVRRIAPATLAALTTIATLAAGFGLFFNQARQAPATASAIGAAPAALIRSRSTDDLFDAATPFPRRGEESARMDRIASARAADLRNNRFAAWGVR